MTIVGAYSRVFAWARYRVSACQATGTKGGRRETRLDIVGDRDFTDLSTVEDLCGVSALHQQTLERHTIFFLSSLASASLAYKLGYLTPAAVLSLLTRVICHS